MCDFCPYKKKKTREKESSKNKTTTKKNRFFNFKFFLFSDVECRLPHYARARLRIFFASLFRLLLPIVRSFSSISISVRCYFQSFYKQKCHLVVKIERIKQSIDRLKGQKRKLTIIGCMFESHKNVHDRNGTKLNGMTEMR